MSHALTFVIATLCILAICYRLYGVFFVRKVLNADDSEVTTSAATLLLSPPQARWLGRCWPPSMVISPAFCGCW